MKILGKVIRFPSSDRLEEVGAGFTCLAGCLAFNVVDGCHATIKPPTVNAQCYFNSKLFCSIQLQAICDHQGQFVDIFMGFAGSVRDTHVLKNTPLFV